MQRRNPDKQLMEIIQDLSQIIPAKRTLVAGATEYVNEYNTKNLIRLLQIVLKRLMPEQSVKVFGAFLGALTPDACDRLAGYFGERVGNFFRFGAVCELYTSFTKKGGFNR